MAEQNSKLDALLEQTSFLLEKHKESKDQYLKLFDDFISIIKSEIQAKQDADKQEDVSKLQHILKIVDGHFEQFKKAAGDDIKFLEDQKAGIAQAKEQCDPIQEKQLFDMLMDGKEISDTEEFKSSVIKESQNSFEGFSSIMDDLNQVFKEGDIDELLLYLESMVSSEDEPATKKSIECTGDDNCLCEECSKELILEFEPEGDAEKEGSADDSSSCCKGGSCSGDCECSKKNQS